jgi:hypothetical protein
MLEFKSQTTPEDIVELNFNWKSKAESAFQEVLIRRLNTTATKRL